MKQHENGRSLANSRTQDRLIASETFQYVTTNPKKYGVASTRNERQLAKTMDSLHLQKNRRIAKLSSQIHEVKVHQWKLKERDDAVRDLRTTEEMQQGSKPKDIGKDGDQKHGKSQTQGALGRSIRKYSGAQNEVGLNLRKNRPSAHISTKTSRSKAGNGHGRIVRHDKRNTVGLKSSEVVELNKIPAGSIANRHTFTTKSTLIDYSLKNMPSRKNPRVLQQYKCKSYNLVGPKKFVGKRSKTPGDDTKHAKEASNELQGTNDTREKLLTTNANPIGKINTAHHARPRSGQVPKAFETDTMNHDHAANGKRHIVREGSAVDKEDDVSEAGVSDQETRGRDERPSVVEENWAETLKSCRYLRKPRGYETPEIPIESVFQND
ncbi:uncharacterized protein LOC114536704 [Dendronephthya gigantea]|uniref:uncharacterized protein LOC114536704 n=1 Tax=Dendronephthya gigantea TaxID=151771 RepID=UPI00106CADEB|nr:uncharacterized protein LOC114536704 [Dendronephthya gigantea]